MISRAHVEVLKVAHLEFERPLVDLEVRIQELRELAASEPAVESEITKLEEQARALQIELFEELKIWEKVQLSRHPDRPYFGDYVDRLFTDFVELHGDRRYADDAAIIAGFAKFDGRTVAVIGQQKGRTTKEKLKRNFGMPNPEGYRKAMRIMELASRFKRPVLTFIDTPGAYPGLGAEERGQSQAIGESLLVMSQLGVPVVATVIGEGGSGGALALGVANRVLMMEYATYSVITPEGCASILWRDGARAADAAEALKLLAPDAKRLGVVDQIIEEPPGGAHRNFDDAAARVGLAIRQAIGALDVLSPAALIEDRYQKFRRIGMLA